MVILGIWGWRIRAALYSYSGQRSSQVHREGLPWAGRGPLCWGQQEKLKRLVLIPPRAGPPKGSVWSYYFPIRKLVPRAFNKQSLPSLKGRGYCFHTLGSGQLRLQRKIWGYCVEYLVHMWKGLHLFVIYCSFLTLAHRTVDRMVPSSSVLLYVLSLLCSLHVRGQK